MLFHLTLKSKNVKTGEIPVSTSSRETCNPECSFYRKCYPEYGQLKWHWNKVSNGTRGDEFKGFIQKIKELPAGEVWRYGQAGDLPGKKAQINGRQLKSLVKANTGKKVISYTHKRVLGKSLTARRNRKHIENANKLGFTVNLSADNLTHADKLKKLKIGPVVAVVPSNTDNVTYTPAGNKVVICPAQQREGITCQSCRLCHNRERSVIVGFLPHGTNKRKIDEIAGK